MVLESQIDEDNLIEAIDMATRKVLTVTGDQHQQLLPGIPDEITLNKICTKLPWRAVYILSFVSPVWQRATRSRQVYEVRVRSQATETLVVLGRIVNTKSFSFDLYSLQDKVCYPLPWLTQLEGIRSWGCKCISLDGKVYAMGRITDQSKTGEEVCVLDVMAGHWGWRNCADMQARRERFGCGVMDGKIFVIGGTNYDEDHETGSSEVYDPVTNVWSSIPPMKSPRIRHHVATLGDELYVYGGLCPTRHDDSEMLHEEIYSPIKNEWRQVEPWSKSKLLFMPHNKLYSYVRVRAHRCRDHEIYECGDGIYVHNDDNGKNS